MSIEKSEFFLSVEKHYLAFQLSFKSEDFDQGVFKELLIALWTSLKLTDVLRWEMTRVEAVTILEKSLSLPFEVRAKSAINAVNAIGLEGLPKEEYAAAAHLVRAFLMGIELIDAPNDALQASINNNATRSESLFSAVYLSLSGLWLPKSELSNAH